jgi:hypothetical protein
MSPIEDFGIELVVEAPIPQQSPRVESLNEEVLQNLLVFMANAKDAQGLVADLELKLSNTPYLESKKEGMGKILKFIKVIAKNFDKLGFFESGDPKEIQKDLELSCQRAINKENPKPESRVELSAYRSYIPDEFDLKDSKLFNSLDRDSQSILMSCAIIHSAVNAINKSKQNSTDQPEIYSKILKPLIKYSQEEKEPHPINKYSFYKPSPINSLIGAFVNSAEVLSSFTYLAVNNAVDHRILSFFSSCAEIGCGIAGYYLKNKNYSTSFSKLMRNQAVLMSTSALIFSGQILSKGDFKQNEKNNLFADSILAAHYINSLLGLALIIPEKIMPENIIKDFYEKVDKKFDEKVDEMMNKIKLSYMPALKSPTKEQELFWLEFLSKDTKKNEEVDSKQSPKSSPRSAQVNQTERDHEIHHAIS